MAQGIFGIARPVIAALFVLKADLSPNQATLLNILIGIETTGYASVIAFWIGSSSGSQTKDRTIASTLQGVAAPVGKAVAKKVAK